MATRPRQQHHDSAKIEKTGFRRSGPRHLKPHRSRFANFRRFLWENSLSLTLLMLFAIFVGGQSLAGWLSYNEELREHGSAALGYAQYLVSAHFWESLAENWESEFLQMGIYVLLTSFLIQKGSAESKPLEGNEHPEPHPHKDSPWPVRRGGWWLKLYEHSLTIAMLSLFVFCFLLHAWSGARAHSHEEVLHGRPPVGMFSYMVTSKFWFESLQNWQSEFLSVAVLILLAIFLRARGSSQSKPVDAPHSQTGE